MLPRFIRPLASIRLTVILLIVIGLAMVFGTTYESSVGARVAQVDVYHSIWFDFLLGLLAINLIACTLERYPFKLHQIVWLFTHIGVLVILAGAVISRNWGIEGQMAVAEGQSSNSIDLISHQLEVTYPDGVNGILPLRLESLPRSENAKPKVVDLPKQRGKLNLLRFLPSAVGEVKMEDDPNGLPAIAIRFDAPMASNDAWLWSGKPENARWQLPMVGTIQLIALNAIPPDVSFLAQLNVQYLLIAVPGQMYVWHMVDNKPQVDPITIGQKFSITAQSSITVTQLREHVVLRTYFEPTKGQNGIQALQFSVTDPQGNTSKAVWIRKGMDFAFGPNSPTFVMSAEKYDLGFAIELKKFKRDFYPGTRQSASFASDVVVHDPQQGEYPYDIYMNHTLDHRGWKFYQSSFIEGNPTYSIFSVAYDPGTWTVYAGCIILMLGLVGIVTVKPYLRKRFAPDLKDALDE